MKPMKPGFSTGVKLVDDKGNQFKIRPGTLVIFQPQNSTFGFSLPSGEKAYFQLEDGHLDDKLSLLPRILSDQIIETIIRLISAITGLVCRVNKADPNWVEVEFITSDESPDN